MCERNRRYGRARRGGDTAWLLGIRRRPVVAPSLESVAPACHCQRARQRARGPGLVVRVSATPCVHLRYAGDGNSCHVLPAPQPRPPLLPPPAHLRPPPAPWRCWTGTTSSSATTAAACRWEGGRGVCVYVFVYLCVSWELMGPCRRCNAVPHPATTCAPTHLAGGQEAHAAALRAALPHPAPQAVQVRGGAGQVSRAGAHKRTSAQAQGAGGRGQGARCRGQGAEGRGPERDCGWAPGHNEAGHVGAWVIGISGLRPESPSGMRQHRNLAGPLACGPTPPTPLRLFVTAIST